MALFHVARYPGPGAAEAWAAEVGAGGRARVLLERLQCRARERQQQQREPAPVQADARCAEAAGRRRRRRPRRRRRASRSPDARLTKRRRELGEGADESEDAGAPVVGARVAGPRSRAGGGADWRVCGAGTSEAAPEQRSAHAESPQQEAGCPSPGPVLGGFARRKTPKVSSRGGRRRFRAPRSPAGAGSGGEKSGGDVQSCWGVRWAEARAGP